MQLQITSAQAVQLKQPKCQSSGGVWKSRWPSWAPRPNEPYGFCGRKATLNHAHALVTHSLSLICQPDIRGHEAPHHPKTNSKKQGGMEVGEEREYTPIATPSPPGWLLHLDGQRWEPFECFINCKGQSHNTVSTNRNLFEEKGEPKRESNRGPSAYQPNALPLGQTGSNTLSVFICRLK